MLITDHLKPIVASQGDGAHTPILTQGLNELGTAGKSLIFLREYLVDYWSFISGSDLRQRVPKACDQCKGTGFFIVCKFTAKCSNNPSYQAKARNARIRIAQIMVTTNFFRMYLIDNWSFLSVPQIHNSMPCNQCRSKRFFIVCKLTAKCSNNPSYQAKAGNAMGNHRHHVRHARIIIAHMMVTNNFFRMYLIDNWSFLSVPQTSRRCYQCRSKRFFIVCNLRPNVVIILHTRKRAEMRWEITMFEMQGSGLHI